MDTPLIDAARAWVIERYPYNRHTGEGAEWLGSRAPDSAESVRCALTHDMERAFRVRTSFIKTPSDPA